MNTTMIGLDIAKAVFEVHGIDARGRTTVKWLEDTTTSATLDAVMKRGVHPIALTE